MSWWHTTSRENRLRQVKAGIALGLTYRQIGLASGISDPVRAGQRVRMFASFHGLRQPQFGKTRPRQRLSQLRRRDIERLRAAYFAGERMEFAK